MATNANDKKVLLNSAKDWGEWNTQFQTRAAAAQVWDKIDPDFVGREEFITKPLKPQVGDYEKKRMVLRTLGTVRPSGRPSGSRLTRGSSTTADDSYVTTTSEEPDLSGIPATSIAELTAEGRSGYQIAVALYKQEEAEYNREIEHVRLLKNWVVLTISSHFATTSCPPRDNIDKWYTNLKVQVGATDSEERKIARIKYWQAVKPLTKQPRDMSKWILDWEHALYQAKLKGVPNVQTTEDWFNDFENAIKGADPR
jgi:hypothetical protein